MKKNFFLLFLLLFSMFLFSGCSSKEEDTSPSTVTTITSKEAKSMMDEDQDIIILDVRTEEEYKTGHIENSLLIPNTDILTTAEELLPDKDATILVYCRSGRRSALAATDLVSLGYTNVFDFGGISDWEYDIVTE